MKFRFQKFEDACFTFYLKFLISMFSLTDNEIYS